LWFKNQESARDRVALLKDLGIFENKAHFIWAVLQCHVIVNRFVELEFWGHPSITKEMSIYMLTERVHPSEIAALRAKVEFAEQTAAGAVNTARLLETQHTQLKVECARAKNESMRSSRMN
jgi:hypothetical protein